MPLDPSRPWLSSSSSVYLSCQVIMLETGLKGRQTQRLMAMSTYFCQITVLLPIVQWSYCSSDTSLHLGFVNLPSSLPYQFAKKDPVRTTQMASIHQVALPGEREVRERPHWSNYQNAHKTVVRWQTCLALNGPDLRLRATLSVYYTSKAYPQAESFYS